MTEQLRRYAADNLPEGRKSLSLPSGKLKFHKQEPKFYDADNHELTGKSKSLLVLVKSTLPQYVKITQEESVAWSSLKKNLTIDGDKVYFTETGELRNQI